MAKEIVLQLQKDALDDSIDIETLIRKAFLVAKKLKLKEFEEWILNEQNGYEDAVPDYRIISGDVKAWNPYHGWTPVVAQDAKLEDLLRTAHMSLSIAVISDVYNNSDGLISLGVNGKLVEFLNKNSTSFQTNYSFKASKAELKKILSAVRNKILEWALLLEENGILGDEVSFTEEEKNVAISSPTINNYINNFYSSVDNSQIQQGGEKNTIE